MRTTHRVYAGEAGDFHRLCRFVMEHRDHLRARSTWCLGRVVDWKYGLYGSKTAVAGFCEKNGELWFDGFGELAGLAISESGGTDFAILTTAGYRFLYEEILQWVLEHWGGRGPTLETEVTELQAIEAQALERAGFCRGQAFSTQRFDLTGKLPGRVPLEPGFTIVDMATHGDYRAQRIMRHDAFDGSGPFSEADLQHELEFYNHVHAGPIYHPQTDLCVMAEDGTFVAGCEALIDARNAEADIERVCTHSGYRRRGFARAVIQECLYRLRDMGMRSAYITGYSPEAMALYGSLGAVAGSRSFVYERGEG